MAGARSTTSHAALKAEPANAEFHNGIGYAYRRLGRSRAVVPPLPRSAADRPEAQGRARVHRRGLSRVRRQGEGARASRDPREAVRQQDLRRVPGPRGVDRQGEVGRTRTGRRVRRPSAARVALCHHRGVPRPGAPSLRRPCPPPPPRSRARSAVAYGARRDARAGARRLRRAARSRRATSLRSPRRWRRCRPNSPAPASRRSTPGPIAPSSRCRCSRAAVRSTSAGPPACRSRASRSSSTGTSCASPPTTTIPRRTTATSRR